MKKFILFFGLLVSFWATTKCSHSDLTPDLTYKINENSTYIYSVEEQKYTVSEPPSTTNYYVKEVFLKQDSTNNEIRFDVEQYKRKSATDSWQFVGIYQLIQTPDQLVKMENNLPRVLLSFPVNTQTEWNQNQFNSEQPLVRSYKNIGETFMQQTPTYAVYEINDSTLINLNRRFEVYHPQKGMLFKENTALNYCQSSPDCIGKGQIDFGTRTIWKRMF